MRLLVGLCVGPAQLLQVPQAIMVRELLRQDHEVFIADLWHHDHASNLLHPWIYGVRDPQS